MIQSPQPIYNRRAFYTVHGVTIVLDLVVIGICAWVASDAVQSQVYIPQREQFGPIIMLTAASTAALWSSILIVLAGSKIVVLPLGTWYHLACTGLVNPLYIAAAIILAIKIDRVGSCRYDPVTSLDHSDENCAELWRKLESVQIVAVVLAGIVPILLFVETIYAIRWQMKARKRRHLRMSLA